MSYAGDVNGDGIDDLIVGASSASPNNNNASGSSYVIFGKTAAFGASIDLASLSAADGFRLDGVASLDSSGRSVSSAGDVNGDGFDDFIIGAFRADNDAGSSYVIFGKATGFGSSIDLGSLLAADGFRLDGVAADDVSGYSVSSAGDVNGDGFDDLIIGAYSANPGSNSNAGSSYVVFGKATGFGTSVDLGSLLAADGFRLDGAAVNDFSGYSVSSAGDVNGDGFDDLIVGAFNADPGNNSNSGSSYVVFGMATGFGSSLNLNSLSGADGFRLDGAAAADSSGISVSSAGDFNGDGFDDLIVGASGADPNGISNSGSSYVVFGKAGGFAVTINLGGLLVTDGFRLNGVATADNSGISVSSAGDVNGDGYDDLIVGAHSANPNSVTDSGSTYIIFGGGQYAANDAVASTGDNALIGTTGADTINGLAGDDVIKTGAGDDVLIGGLGADRLYGGGGADTFQFTRGDSIIVIGGTGGDNGTVSGYDVIEDFRVGDGTRNSETFEIVGATFLVNDADFSRSNTVLTIDGQTIKSVRFLDGKVYFDDQTSFSQALEISTEGEVAAAVEFLQINQFGATGTTTAFDVGGDTFIYSEGADGFFASDFDILVRLEGVHIDQLTQTLGNGAGDLFLQ